MTTREERSAATSVLKKNVIASNSVLVFLGVFLFKKKTLSIEVHVLNTCSVLKLKCSE